MEERFASELLAEVKQQAKRWFIAFLVMTALEACTVAWFTLPFTEETTKEVTVDGEEGDANYFDSNTVGGDLTNGKDSSQDNDKEKKNREQTQKDKEE